jgi:cytochrome c-type biogenesis protein CcsB
MTSTLSDISVVMLYSAMAVYALAFIAFAMDLARRSAETPRVQVTMAVGDPSAVTAATGGTTTVTRQATGVPKTPSPFPRTREMRVAIALTTLGGIVHFGATIARGIAAGRLPWANMYEFSMTGTLAIIIVFLAIQFRSDLRFLGTFITGLVLLLLGISTVGYYVQVAPLVPALQSYWLVIHVVVAVAATAFFALGFALSAIQLLRKRGQGRSVSKKRSPLRILATLPDAELLESQAYRVTMIGFILWTFTLMAGSIWAHAAWGRYWGWDTKEVWTFIIWVLYAGYIHARATRGWRGTRSAWLAMVGFAAVLFNFGIVNIFFKGLHAYSGL